MSKVDITITTPAQALKDATSVWRRIEAGDENIVSTISFGSPSELFAATTDRHLELLRHIASHEARSIHQLAQALGRDYKNVYTDVKAREEPGLLGRTGNWGCRLMRSISGWRCGRRLRCRCKCEQRSKSLHLTSNDGKRSMY